jgi:hypothetical protein
MILPLGSGGRLLLLQKEVSKLCRGDRPKSRGGGFKARLQFGTSQLAGCHGADDAQTELNFHSGANQ